MKRAAIVGIAVAGAVIVVGGGLAWWTLSGGGPSAEDAARSYLAALAAGDLDAVQAMREPLPPAQEELLENAFLGASEFISDPRIDQLTERSGGLVQVRASAELGGDRLDLAFQLEDDGDGWTLVGDHAGGLTVDATLGGAPLGHVLVGDVVAPAATPLALLPAEYPVDAAPRGILEGSIDVAVGAGTPTTATLTASLAPGASEIVQEQLNAYAEECTAPAEVVPEHCGLVVPWPADLSSLERMTFRVERYPAVVLSADARSFDATGGALVATAHGQARDGGGPASFTYRTDEWALRGSVALEGDRVVLSVR